MRKTIAKLTVLALLLTLNPISLLAAPGDHHGNAPPFAPGQGLQKRMPAHAAVGSTAERRAAWEKLTPEQRQQYMDRFAADLGPALRAAAAKQRGPDKPVPRDKWILAGVLGKKVRGENKEAAQQPAGAPFLDSAGKMRIIDPEPYPDPWPYPENQPPVASAWASPTAGPAPLTVQFSSSAYDPDGWITDYYWDFGDGGWSYESYPVHTYSAPGTYTAWFSVTDDGGLSAWTAVNVTVTNGANLPPQVTAVANPASGYVPLNVGFQAYASDPDGFIASYFWSFGDGGWSSAAAPTHAYGTPGTYTASVTVTDNYGATATSSVSIQALPAPAGSDADGDRLPDGFETSLADAFTPIYHVSAGEQYGTGFARFGDYVPQTVIQNLPAVPPLSHYRVTPVGITTDSYGRQLGFLEIDYLTLWNRDDGLQIGGDCRVYASILGGLIGYGLTGLLDGMQSHAIDDERSAVLVAAPTVAGTYDTNLGSYAAYSYYTAAHEGTFFDHSLYFSPSQPVAPYNHLLLGLSRAKHATYPFNPDYYPLFPDWVIFTTYITIDDLYWSGWIDDYSYMIYLYMADTLFYSCVVEHFQDQGGWIADPRINVGELPAPLNGSGFINDPKLRDKLSWLLWRVY